MFTGPFRAKGVGKESNAVISTAMARAGTTIKTTKKLRQRLEKKAKDDWERINYDHKKTNGATIKKLSAAGNN